MCVCVSLVCVCVVCACTCVVVVCGGCCGVVVVSVVACLKCELCFGTSRSVLDPSWFGLRPSPCVKGSYLRLDFKGPALSVTQAENEKFRTASANDCFHVLDKCGFVFSVASFQNSLVFRRG